MEPEAALTLHNEFSMLNLADLLLARERNHVELIRKKHVVGTAVGLYLIRKREPWKPIDPTKRGKRGPRTLGNSEVRDYSWPCILAFVDEWKAEEELDWQDRVPPSVYLDERRKVPVCVVYAPKVELVEVPIRPVVYPSTKIGGGFPLILMVQGREHIASIGCLVRDGHTVYALTNRHVTGPEGEVVYARLGGGLVRIGVSSSKQLTRRSFSKIYPAFAGKETYINLDVGLVRIDDINCWTASVYGIGEIGPMADLGADNLSLRLVDCPVRGYGCGSGLMKGALKALFYRYKSLGGFEYVSDFLIGPRKEHEDLNTHPGDSGTLWLLESQYEGLMPIAVQWGGQVFAGAGVREQASYALATCLSAVCNILDVDVIRDWNVGVTEYWGEVGHYAIGALACTLTFTGLAGLEKLMSRNIDRVGFAVADLGNTDKVLKNKAHYTFVPLADVADDVWRNTRIGHGETNNDGNNHFADMDQPAATGRFAGKTLLDLCEDPANVDPAIWLEFYQNTPGTSPGALPFRVWQGYDLMVAALNAGDVLTFVCVAGCVAHYVGDGCQPLHISRLHHNDPQHQNSVGRDVHSVYETGMLNLHAGDIVQGMVTQLKTASVSGSFTGGHGAAVRVVQLMTETIAAIAPQDICDAYNEETKPADRVNRLWTDFGDKTITRLAQGAICMADLWASAWKEGNGAAIPQSALAALDPNALAGLYKPAAFFPSMSLELMVPVLTTPDGPITPNPTLKRRAGRRSGRVRAAAKRSRRPKR